MVEFSTINPDAIAAVQMDAQQAAAALADPQQDFRVDGGDVSSFDIALQRELASMDNQSDADGSSIFNNFFDTIQELNAEKKAMANSLEAPYQMSDESENNTDLESLPQHYQDALKSMKDSFETVHEWQREKFENFREMKVLGQQLEWIGAVSKQIIDNVKETVTGNPK